MTPRLLRLHRGDGAAADDSLVLLLRATERELDCCLDSGEPDLDRNAVDLTFLRHRMTNSLTITPMSQLL
jgi:hypothetical protein